MNIKTLLRVSSVVSLLFGLGALFVPVELFGLFEIELNAATSLPAQVLGAAIFSSGLVFHYGTRALASPALHAIVVGSFAYNCISLALIVMGLLEGVLSMAAWLMIGLHGVLAIGFGYFLFVHQVCYVD